ncbi:TonB-dependent receptor [Haliea atlantica]
MFHHSHIYTSVVLATIGFGNSGALAQSQEPSPRALSALLEEVTVYAQKKSSAEQIQDIPVAISAVSGAQIEAVGATDLTDISFRMPNVRLKGVGTVPGAAAFTIRGMGTISSIPSVDPTVGLFVDGIYYGVSWGMLLELSDIESMEVLRGPQGTLFGRNVTGGAVLIHSKRPTEEFEGRIKVDVGNYGTYGFSGSVSGSLIEDKLLGKITVLHRENEGYYDNLAADAGIDVESEIGELEANVIKPSLTFRPSDDWEFTLLTEFGKQKFDSPALKADQDRVNSVTGSLLANGIGRLGKFEVANDFIGNGESEWTNAVLDSVWYVGEGTLKSITGYREIEQNFPLDVDGSPSHLFHTSEASGLDQSQWSQEFVYSSPITQTIDLTSGLFYFSQEMEYSDQRLIPVSSFSDRQSRGIQDQTTLGVFAQGDFHLNNNWIATVGARYSYETKDVKVAPFGSCNGNPAFSECDFILKDDASFSTLSPKVGIRWQPNDDLNIYASFTKGFRSGGFNLRPSSAADGIGPYDEESVEAFEIGLKGAFADGKVRANLAYFYNSYEDLQRSAAQITSSGDLQNTIDNAASATIQGLELDATFAVTDSFVIMAVAGYTDASYDEYNIDITGDGIPDPQQAKKLELTNAPELTWSLSTVYDVPLDFGNLTLRASYSHTDDFFINETNLRSVDSFGIVNANASLALLGGDLEVNLYGKNLSDEEYFMNGVTPGSITGGGFLNPPRTVGVSVSYYF